MLNELAKEVHEIAKSKGFYDEPREIPERLMLITCEVAEAMEEYRKVDFNEANFAEELSDILIRVLDLSASMGLDINHHVRKKIEKNKTRPYRHGKRL